MYLKIPKLDVSPLLLLLRTAYSAATGSIQPLEMSAPAGSCKRSRADFEPEGAPAEADAATAPTEPSRSLLEELRVKVDVLKGELAANRRFTTQAQQFVDREEAKLTVPVDEVLVEGMKEEIGKLRTADCTLLRQIRVLRTKRDGWMGWIDVCLSVCLFGEMRVTEDHDDDRDPDRRARGKTCYQGHRFRAKRIDRSACCCCGCCERSSCEQVAPRPARPLCWRSCPLISDFCAAPDVWNRK